MKKKNYNFLSLYDSVDIATGIVENEDGVMYGDYYWVSIGDLRVVLCVCKTSLHQVCVYEVAMKRRKNGGSFVALPLAPEKKKRCIVVRENNCPTKSTMWVNTYKNKTLSIELNGRLYVAYPLAFAIKKMGGLAYIAF